MNPEIIDEIVRRVSSHVAMEGNGVTMKVVMRERGGRVRVVKTVRNDYLLDKLIGRVYRYRFRRTYLTKSNL